MYIFLNAENYSRTFLTVRTSRATYLYTLTHVFNISVLFQYKICNQFRRIEIKKKTQYFMRSHKYPHIQTQTQTHAQIDHIVHNVTHTRTLGINTHTNIYNSVHTDVYTGRPLVVKNVRGYSCHYTKKTFSQHSKYIHTSLTTHTKKATCNIQYMYQYIHSIVIVFAVTINRKYINHQCIQSAFEKTCIDTGPDVGVSPLSGHVGPPKKKGPPKKTIYIYTVSPKGAPPKKKGPPKTGIFFFWQ